MTTTKTLIVSLIDSSTDEIVPAEHFILDGGWVTLTDEDDHAVAVYPAQRIASIKRGAPVESPPTVTVDGSVRIAGKCWCGE